MRARPGSALILVLMMTLAVAGLSIAAIFMSSSAGLLSAYYDREREYRLAAEAALAIVRSRLTQDSALVIPDTGMRQLLAGFQVRDASGNVLTRVRTNVYAAVTGDTSGTLLPHVTLIAAAYDASGTRHVRRMDLRRESFSRYSLFVDSFPASLSHGPGTVPGRVHTNDTWRSLTGSTYLDTVTALATVGGVGTYNADSIVGVPRVPFPKDSTFPRMDALASAANLSFVPVTGGTRASHLEFVSFDADLDGDVERHESFVRVFDLSAGGMGDTLRLRASPPILNFFMSWNRFDHDIVQNQCGAFYLRTGRWHFFPLSTHRRPYAAAVVQSLAAGDYPQVPAAKMAIMDDFSIAAADSVMTQPTARCFPAGSPYLMPAERMTNPAGAVTLAAADTVPFGVVPPAGGWPLSAPNGYGGSDTTFTIRSRTCTVVVLTGRCSGGLVFDLGVWRAFPGTAVGGISATARQAVELPYLWPYTTAYNSASRGVISATAGPLYVSGQLRGKVTLRAAGRVTLIDDLTYETDPADPGTTACEDQLGIVAVGDILVVSGLATRSRVIATSAWPFDPRRFNTNSTGGKGFRLHGSVMSLTGTVGAELTSFAMLSTAWLPPCPENGAVSTVTHGGCLRHVGGAAMRRYSALYGSSNSGMRYQGILDRCQNSAGRPPFFPLTNRYTFVRTLELEPSNANTPTKIRTLLLRLKGKTL